MKHNLWGWEHFQLGLKATVCMKTFQIRQSGTPVLPLAHDDGSMVLSDRMTTFFSEKESTASQEYITNPDVSYPFMKAHLPKTKGIFRITS